MLVHRTGRSTRRSGPRRIGGLALVAASFVMVAGSCTQTDSGRLDTSADPEADSAPAVPAAVLADAGTRTCGEVTSGRVRSTISVEGDEGDTAELTAEAVFDVSAERSRMSVDTSRLASMLADDDLPDVGTGSSLVESLGGPFEVVVDGATVYLAAPLLTTLLGADTPWVAIPVDGFEGTGGVDGLLPDRTQDACDAVEVLEQVGGDVLDLGTEELAGVGTTHYQATVEPDEALAGLDLPAAIAEPALGPAVVDVWVDDVGLVRRIETRTALTEPVERELLLTVELTDVNEAVEIELPPESEVTPFDLSTLGGFGGSGDG